MKMAKPSEADFESVLAFLQAAESVFGAGLDPDTEKQLDEGYEIQACLENKWESGAAHAWQRVLWAGKTAIDNCCDPNATTLEHKPEIAKALAMEALAREFAAALVTFVEVSKHALKRWDSDEDSKVGKLLSAMSGHLTGYRHDITAIHAIIAKAKDAIGDVQPIPDVYTPAAATA